MPEKHDFLALTEEGLKEIKEMFEIPAKFKEVFEMLDKQVDARQSAIQIINQMCDALYLACDLISKEISASIIDYYQLRAEKDDTQEDKEKKSDGLMGFFKRTTFKYAEDSLRNLLHEGGVCGQLHALRDGFRQPFSGVTRGGVSFSEAIRALFTRSTTMSQALDGLHRGEDQFLNNTRYFLDEIRDKAENALSLPWVDINEMIKTGDELTVLLRQKRGSLREQVEKLRTEADKCIELLH